MSVLHRVPDPQEIAEARIAREDEEALWALRLADGPDIPDDDDTDAVQHTPENE